MPVTMGRYSDFEQTPLSSAVTDVQSNLELGQSKTERLEARLVFVSQRVLFDDIYEEQV